MVAVSKWGILDTGMYRLISIRLGINEYWQFFENWYW